MVNVIIWWPKDGTECLLCLYAYKCHVWISDKRIRVRVHTCDVGEGKIGWNVPGIKAAEISANESVVWSTDITAHISDPLDWDTAC